ncbi:MamI family restriction endonuclease [Microbacterium hydrothermale]|uniref:MamI family restriction endonuclease n=1 Tax=Microbacterium hydrothermale TaxID=857427 RepID=UPI0010A921CB|nr:MamI family restriction endonuclease [Microbacterium hydrothermale]
MQNAVNQAIIQGIRVRREILSSLSYEQRVVLLEDLFVDLFGHQHVMLQRWAALTGQSAQVDTGYIAQFVASIVLGEPGQGFRGKGDDLADGSEVKSAANISGVDRPRWNHNLGSLDDDERRRGRNLQTAGDEYLGVPLMFYLLVDRPHGVADPAPIRIRAWCIDAQQDRDWRSLFETFLASRSGRTYNFQLHPPVGYDDDVVVNTLGNLDFADVLIFDARLSLADRNRPSVDWHLPLPQRVLPIAGRTRARQYDGKGARPTRLTGTADVVLGTKDLGALFPGVLDPCDSNDLVVISEIETDADVRQECS